MYFLSFICIFLSTIHDCTWKGKLDTEANVKAAKPNAQKVEASVGKEKAKIEEPKKDDKPKAEDDEDDSEDDESDESDHDEVCY